eukprot:CCRYP_003524-RA/>CCRYP_003524-RA protein AED:0.03 eAED:-0.03 QI:0/-1/0/1/-1/1/1/0/352
MKSLFSISTSFSIILCLCHTGPVQAQQQVQLFTTSSKFQLSLSTDRTFSVNDLFQFESATSKLFHENVSDYHGNGVDAHAVVTGVHVERVKREPMENSGDYAMIIDSVVSMTFSEVGLSGALVRGMDDGETLDISSVLSSAVTADEVMSVLQEHGLADDATSIVDLSFSPYQGSINQLGVYFTDTDLVSKRRNSGWPMFFAGVMIALLLCGIMAIALWLYLNENGTWIKRQNSTKSVHYEGDVDVEEATTASGVLGLKGHHPQAEVDKENDRPNRRNRRPKKSASLGSKSSWTVDTDDVGTLTPMSQQSVVSASSRHPLGITSMRKLNTFLTPQKPKSDRVVLYDIDRFSYT